MLDRASARGYNFDVSDDTIHKFATLILLSEQDSEFTLTQGKYAYQVKGGKGGHLCYKKGTAGNWVLIANWCFYGLYMVVRYRKSLWLRPMYQNLFAKMNFISVTFHDHSIEVVGTDGEILRSRRFRLSPPFALEEVMAEKFGYSKDQVETLKVKLNL
jgi:hypothetical protein